MGKKKIRQGSVAAVDPKKLAKNAQTQKNYKFQSDKAADTSPDSDLVKVELRDELQTAIVELILERRERFSADSCVSKRITSKKLMDVYTCLSSAGFKRSQVEDAMSHTMQYGGDLIDALDWLCLNMPNDQLPGGFSQTFIKEEEKTRARFKDTPATMTPAARPTTQPFPQSSAAAAPEKTPKSQVSMKDWILQYADNEDSAEESEETVNGDHTTGPLTFDLNERYQELAARLVDARSGALQAKQECDQATQKALSETIRQYTHEINELEKHPDFNPAMRTASSDEGTTPSRKQGQKCDEDFSGFSMFDEPAQAAKPPTPAKRKTRQQVAPLEKRCFAYTRQQWTGKSPKQFLIDWMRRHLAASPPPSFHKVCLPRQLYCSRVKIVRKEGDLEFCPDICSENLKEAEHLAATLALYHLCRGQSVHQLLPLPYREVWLDWRDAEQSASEANQVERDKPRDMFVSRLLKKLTVTVETIVDPDDPIEVESTWEALADEEEEEEEEKREEEGERREVAPPAVRVSASRRRGVSAAQLRQLMAAQQRSATWRQMLAGRSRLPVYQHRAAILERIGRESVVLIAGETGSGKSTQIPQFILEASVEAGVPCHIVCTQPRRISAISLAHRVCDELAGPPPGTGDALCGYQIRLESRITPATCLHYVTTGVLLRRLQSEPRLDAVTHVIVDEVHERSVQSDFLLIVLRELLETRSDLKVILMSATLDAARFSAYFQHCPVIDIPGRTFPVEVFHLEDVIEMTQYKLEHDSRYAIREDKLVQEGHSRIAVTGKRGETSQVDVSWQKQDIQKIDYSGLDCDAYCLHTRNVMSRLHKDRVNVDLIVELLHYITSEHQSEEGAVLVFLPGLSHIQELAEALQADRTFSDKKRFWVVVLHSVLSSCDQQRAFTTPPSRVRKIVIATNIAETGITIPDVVFVIDSGKVKETRYVESSQMSVLEEVFVSRASAVQRQGRAGRVTEGVTFRLYSRQKFESLKAYTVPEILRVPVEELCLHILKCECGDPTQFLQLALDPPSPQTVTRAMTILKEVGACTYGVPTLTPLGHHLAALPVDVRIGKMLVFAAIFGCLDAMSVIAAAISEKSIYETRIERPSGPHMDDTKCGLAVANSDHITVYNAFLRWQHAKTLGNSSEMQFCRKHALKRGTLMEIEKVSSDLRRLVTAAGLGGGSMCALLRLRPSRHPGRGARVLQISQSDAPAAGAGAADLSPALIAVLKAVLTAGLYPNVACVSSPREAAPGETRQPCTAQTPQGGVQAHQASVNRFYPGPGWLVYHEKVKLAVVYLRDSTAISPLPILLSCVCQVKLARVYLRDSTAISPLPILLFGGSISVQHKQRLVCVDDLHNFTAFAKTGVMFKELRLLLDDVLRDKLRLPGRPTPQKLHHSDDAVVAIILDLIVSESETRKRS